MHMKCLLAISKLAYTCSMWTIETLEKGVKSVHS